MVSGTVPCPGPVPAPGISNGEGSVRGAHETVIHIVRVNVLTHDRSSVVDAGTLGALVRAGARAWSVEGTVMVPSGARR